MLWRASAKARFGLALSGTIHHPLIIAKLNKARREGFTSRRINQQALKVTQEGYSTDKT
jgi:hypothetical protein